VARHSPECTCARGQSACRVGRDQRLAFLVCYMVDHLHKGAQAHTHGHRHQYAHPGTKGGHTLAVLFANAGGPGLRLLIASQHR